MESFDHCYSANDTLPTVVLYGEIGTVEFSEFFKSFMAENGVWIN